MARKITLFEMYFEGAQFGPTSEPTARDDDGDFESAAADPDDGARVESDDEVSGSRLRSALVAVGGLATVSVAALVVRRFRGSTDADEFAFEERGHDPVDADTESAADADADDAHRDEAVLD